MVFLLLLYAEGAKNIHMHFKKGKNYWHYNTEYKQKRNTSHVYTFFRIPVIFCTFWISNSLCYCFKKDYEQLFLKFPVFFSLTVIK